MLSDDSRRSLLAIARQSIRHGIKFGYPLQINLNNYPAELKVLRATFVTLEIQHQLRGCIGLLEAVRPLVIDIAENSWAAAFADPRFSALNNDELNKIVIHLSILAPSERIHFNSEQDLVDQITPGVDGLILEEGEYRGTFLPAVWESLPKTTEFLKHLKLKAGLPSNYWSENIKISRYTTESFSEITAIKIDQQMSDRVQTGD